MQIWRQLSIAARKNLAPNIIPLKLNLNLTDQSGELSNISDQSLPSFSVFEIVKMAMVDFETRE